MLLCRLHTASWNRPELLFKIDLVSDCAQDLARPAGRQDREFQRACRHGRPRPQFEHERRDVVISKGRMVAPRQAPTLGQELIEVTSPTRRILAVALAPRPGGTDH